MAQERTICFAGKVVMVYEDLKTGLRGKKFINTLESQLQLASGFNVSLWQWETLREPIIREQAAIEARDADLIIVSANGNTCLPDEVQDWLERWLDQKEERWYAIEVLLDSSPAALTGDDSDPLMICLARYAKEGHADLFMTLNNRQGGELAPIWSKSPASNQTTLFTNPMMNGAMQGQYSGLGENQ